MARSRRGSAKQKRIEPRVKVWLEIDGDYVFGFGISEILKAVESAGSIKGAADELGKSYRHVWGRIKQAEQSLGQPLVETRVGGSRSGRSSPTPLAGQLVKDYDALRQRMFDVAADEFSSCFETRAAGKTDSR